MSIIDSNEIILPLDFKPGSVTRSVECSACNQGFVGSSLSHVKCFVAKTHPWLFKVDKLIATKKNSYYCLTSPGTRLRKLAVIIRMKYCWKNVKPPTTKDVRVIVSANPNLIYGQILLVSFFKSVPCWQMAFVWSIRN